MYRGLFCLWIPQRRQEGEEEEEQSREREAQLSSKRSEIESLIFYFVTADLLSWISFCSDCLLVVVVVVVVVMMLQL